VPRGGGTKLGWAGPPRGLDILLSLERLDRLVEHSAGDLTLVAEAGMTLDAVQRALAGDRQFLALDAPLPDRATLGGIVSANVAGPLRQRYGGVRDQLIGLTLARADGKLAKAGGKVVKNVAGYDLMKLLTGAFGTLGVVVRCAFRLYPLPEASGTVVAEVPDPDRLRAALVATADSTLVLAAASVLAGQARARGGEGVAGAGAGEGEGEGETARPLLAARFATVEAAVSEQADTLVRLWRSHGLEPRRLDEASETALWQAAATAFWTADGGSALCKATTTMTLVPTLVDLLASRGGSLLAHALAGVSYLRLAGDPQHTVRSIEEVRAALRAQHGDLVVLDAPEPVRRAVDLWGPVDERVLELMRRIKAEFDPRGTCSPGRFVGGI
jgi:glycolate oxidase FAD binding subunit